MEENKTPNNTPSPITEDNQKKYIYIAIAGAVVLLVLFLVFRNKGNTDDNQVDVNVPGQDTVITPVTSTPSSTVKTPPAPVKTTPTPLSATQKYLDAIRIYKNPGYYFQFVECHGLPGTLTMKKGKKFMLDNRDAKTRKIAISGGQSFKIGAYGFAIATAPAKAGTHYITCDGGGAATILVQP
jgi:hypothetical protein